MPKGDGHDRLYETVGSRIGDARNAAGMSQDKLAGRVGVTRVSIVNIEHGRQRPPLHLIWQIATVLGIEPTSLIPLQIELIGRKSSVQLDGKVIRYIEKQAEDDPTAKRLLTEFIQRVTSQIDGGQDGTNEAN